MLTKYTDMNRKLSAYTFSLLLHVLFFGAYVLFFGKAVKYKHIVEIDLSLTQQSTSNIEEHHMEEKTSMKKEFIQKKGAESIQNIIHKKSKEKVIQNSKLYESYTKSIQESNSTYNEKSENFPKPDERGSIQENNNNRNSEKTLTSNGIGQKNVTENEKRGDTSALVQQSKGETYLREKLSVISSIVKENISYPPIARRMGWEGKVVICFLLKSDGQVENIYVEKSSGYEILDTNAINTIQKVAKLFPKPPVDVMIRLPINYRLE